MNFVRFRWLRDSRVYYIVDKHQSKLEQTKDALSHLYNIFENIESIEKQSLFKFVVTNEYIYNKSIKDIGKQDLVIWNPSTASKNIDIVSNFNSVILLQKPTVYIQKQSKSNPFTENMAINLGLKISYINPENDITNDEYKLVVSEKYYYVDNLTEHINKLITKNNTKNGK